MLITTYFTENYVLSGIALSIGSEVYKVFKAFIISDVSYILIYKGISLHLDDYITSSFDFVNVIGKFMGCTLRTCLFFIV